MTIGIFTDKKNQPTESQVLDAIDAKLSIWEDLIAFIREEYPVQEEFKFMYGKNYGWGLKFRIKTQLLTCLYPADGCFFAQVNLSPEAVEKALQMQLGKNAQQAIARAHPYPEGRWVFIRVESGADAGDVQRLLVLRVQTKRLG